MNANILTMIAILVTVLLGFLGVFVMLFQMNSRFERLEDKIDAINTSLISRIDATNTSLVSRIDAINANLSTRIDAVNSRLDALYRELFKKDAA